MDIDPGHSDVQIPARVVLGNLRESIRFNLGLDNEKRLDIEAGSHLHSDEFGSWFIHGVITSAIDSQ